MTPAPGRATCLLVSAVAGGGLVAAFAPFDLWPLAVLGPLPLLWIVTRRQVSPATAALSGLVFGASFFVGSVHWIVLVMEQFGGLSRPAAVGVVLLLVVYLAAFTTAFAAAMHRLAARHGTVAALVAAPALWAALEFLRNHLLTGFPWVRLGTAMHSFPPLLQLASLTGVYGLSALLIALAGACAALLEMHPAGGLRRPPTGGWAYMLTVLGITVAVLAWGWGESGEPTESGDGLRVACVQGNVAQDRKWDPQEARKIVDRHLGLSRAAVADGAELVVWSESSLPYPLRGAAGSELLRVVRELRVPFLVGSLDWRTDTSGDQPVYNSAFLIGADGEMRGVYDKMHLVPFGEYIPWKDLLSFAAPLVEEVGDLRAGQEATLLGPAGDVPVLGVAICYEIIFPELPRRATKRGAAILVNLTNDAWFGNTLAPHQHFAEAVVRAVETGRFLVRAANTGISGIVDPRGHVLVRSALNEETVITAVVHARTGITPYVAMGDVFVWACAILAAVALLLPRSRAPRPAASRAAPSSRKT